MKTHNIRKGMQVLEVCLPDNNGGRLFTTSRFPERSALAHIHSYVGIGADEENNIKKNTPLYLDDGRIFYLTPNLKKNAIFFVMPSGEK